VAQNTMVNINGIWKNTTPYINIGNNTWKQCTPWINVNGVWKKCGEGTPTMTVYIPSSGDSTLISQSRIISIANLQSVISCTVNTGSVSYSVNGTNVTINVNNGTPVRSYTPPPLTKTDVMQTEPGGDPTSLPSSIYYDSDGYNGLLFGGSAYVYSGSPADSRTGNTTLGTINLGDPASNLPDVYNYNYNEYSGQIPAIGTAYVYSGSPAGSKTCFGTDLVYFVVTNGEVTTGQSKPTIPYNDGEYSGALTIYGVDPAYESNYDALITALDTGTGWMGYILFTYHATLTKIDTRIWRRDYKGIVYKPDTRIWKKDYSGTVYGSITYYYAYVVTLKYTTN